MSNNTNSGGIGFTGLLTLIFVTLKLTETGPVADWSWWWVTAPIWGSILLAVFILAAIGLLEWKK